MKTVCLLFLVLLGIIHIVHSQQIAPLLKRQRSLGGAGRDVINQFGGGGFAVSCKVFARDRGNGYIIASNTVSHNSGDVVGGYNNDNTAYEDIWVAKLDSAFNVTWSKVIGGTSWDYVNSIKPTHDGGYILIGKTESLDGDVTGNHGQNDVWVVKLDRDGNIEWERCYGGSSFDEGKHIEEVSNQGFIFIATTQSRDGDIIGGHLSSDVWVVKIDLGGNIEWQKCFGGIHGEWGIIIKPTLDRGYIVGAAATGNDGDVQGVHENRGFEDFWVLKIDSLGSLEWQKCLGGPWYDDIGDIEQTNDNGYLIAGTVGGGNGGDVSGYHGGGYDAWAVKLNATGEMLWQKCFGGNAHDVFNDIVVMPDDSFVATGWTTSTDIGGLKGLSDYWLTKFSSSGNLVWQKTYGAPGGYQMAYALAATIDNNFLLIGNTNATQPPVVGNHGENDLWLIEVGAGNTIKGYAFYDVNKNGNKDDNEVYFDRLKVSAQKGNSSNSQISNNGFFRLTVDTGTYITTASTFGNYYSISPPSKTSTFSNYFNTDSVNFAVQPLAGNHDLAIDLIPLNIARPGFKISYKVAYQNVGTEPMGGDIIKLVYDNRLTFLNSSRSHSALIGDTIIWNYDELNPLDTASINVSFVSAVPPVLELRDTLKLLAWIEHDINDLNPTDDTFELRQIVLGSYDPNDKSESNGGIITPSEISGEHYLNYVIRFQNTGNDTAFNVIIRDTLDSKLDWASFRTGSSSHGYQLVIQDQNKLTWQLANIQLPDSNINEPASHGFIAYRVKPKNTVAVGDTIKNTASIYFDFNLPVATNTDNTIVLSLSSLPVSLASFDAVLRGGQVEVQWRTTTEYKSERFEIERSLNGIDFIKIGSVPSNNFSNGHTYSFVDKNPMKGHNYYRLNSVDLDGSFKYSSVVLINILDGKEIITSISPNPSNGKLELRIVGSINGKVSVAVFDQVGRQLLNENIGTINSSQLRKTLSLTNLSKGQYVMKILINGKSYHHQFLIQ